MQQKLCQVDASPHILKYYLIENGPSQSLTATKTKLIKEYEIYQTNHERLIYYNNTKQYILKI